MGCVPGDDLCGQDEKPQKKFFIDAFTIDAHETTVNEYTQCVKTGKCDKPRGRTESRFCNWGHPDRKNHPVNCVSWSQADAYCREKGKMLPTQAQWEKAARGELVNKVFAWGNEKADCTRAVMDPGKLETQADISDGCGKNGTWEVCSKSKSSAGLCNIAGNVREWCLDWYDPQFLNFSAPSNPYTTSKTRERTLRGGSWLLGAKDFRISARGFEEPDKQPIDVGFRCVKQLSEPYNKPSKPAAMNSSTESGRN